MIGRDATAARYNLAVIVRSMFLPRIRLLRALSRGAARAMLVAAIGSMAFSAPPARADSSLPSSSAIASVGVDAALPIADRVVVRKSERKLLLMRAGEVLRSYKVSLGLRPEGHKQFEGDYRTPEGAYRLTRRNPNSEFFLSIQIDYPNDRDVARARRQGRNPGGAIMIHGEPNTPRKPRDYYANVDWTEGCIAVSNSDMVEIWLMTAPDTPIEITP
ncbi:MAG TPA: L,D-transpeptidase family protein [Steroidobacter sp.]|nr:L,D-transpeptidase family protein [Steroidobacter sp.]